MNWHAIRPTCMHLAPIQLNAHRIGLQVAIKFMERMEVSLYGHHAFLCKKYGKCHLS